ncbi:glycosyltransferase family 61 protein [Agaribacter flavus]|uniref:Glycosyltransferase family 61 protein n=1 Tax=Agaribacter flavus TaxID=1902781 RepID=A0ABV7FVE6_9ALTE
MEETRLHQFKQLWNSSEKIDIPSVKAFRKRPRLRPLYSAFLSERPNGQSFRVAALRTYGKLDKNEFKGMPKFTSLVDELVTAFPSSKNEFFDEVKVTPEINHLSQIHLTRPSSEFYRFDNVNVQVGTTGLSVSKREMVDPISMCLLKKDHLRRERSFSIKSGVFCSDRFGNGNITHFLYDVIGRYLSLRLFNFKKCGTLILLKGSLNKYHYFVLATFNIPFIEVTQTQAIYCQQLFVSTDITNDHSDGFAHPMKLLQPELFEYIRHKLTDVSKPLKKYEKVYISRADAKLRMVVNEEKVMGVLGHRGFTKVVLGKLTPQEQFSVFNSAEEVIAPHGAAQASMITMAKGGKITEFFHTSLGTDAFAIVAKRLGIEHQAKSILPTYQQRVQATRIPIDKL